jgi:hypothetical protein
LGGMGFSCVVGCARAFVPIARSKSEQNALDTIVETKATAMRAAAYQRHAQFAVAAWMDGVIILQHAGGTAL